jgi:hypothetical protein
MLVSIFTSRSIIESAFPCVKSDTAKMEATLGMDARPMMLLDREQGPPGLKRVSKA